VARKAEEGGALVLGVDRRQRREPLARAARSGVEDLRETPQCVPREADPPVPLAHPSPARTLPRWILADR
jgi:hypothetical protein